MNINCLREDPDFHPCSGLQGVTAEIGCYGRISLIICPQAKPSVVTPYHDGCRPEGLLLEQCLTPNGTLAANSSIIIPIYNYIITQHAPCSGNEIWKMRLKRAGDYATMTMDGVTCGNTPWHLGELWMHACLTWYTWTCISAIWCGTVRFSCHNESSYH